MLITHNKDDKKLCKCMGHAPKLSIAPEPQAVPCVHWEAEWEEMFGSGLHRGDDSRAIDGTERWRGGEDTKVRDHPVMAATVFCQLHHTIASQQPSTIKVRGHLCGGEALNALRGTGSCKPLLHKVKSVLFWCAVIV